MMLNAIPLNCTVFDTETTGFSPEGGDRLVEIGAVRMRDGLPTKERFHVYINPERSVPDAAVKVHGLTAGFLADKPVFQEVVHDFLEFIGEDRMVAHNATFDSRFINFQLAETGLPTFDESRFVDTVPIARKRFPGAQANLDALCRRFKISLKDRSKHGALIDAELLAEVCVELAGGRQFDLFGGSASETEETGPASVMTQLQTFVLRANDEESQRHAALVTKLGPKSIWAQIMQVAA